MNVEEKIRDAIARNKDVLIKYQKYSGEVSIRKISAIEKSEEFGSDYIFAFCRLRNTLVPHPLVPATFYCILGRFCIKLLA